MWRLVAIIVPLLITGAAVLGRVGRGSPRAPLTDEELVPEARALAVILDRIFDAVEAMLAEGVTTRAIDERVQREIAAAGVRSSFLGYNGYPAHCTTSINEEVLNTIPSERALKRGDLLKLQIGIAGKRTFAIRAWTYAIGPVADEDQRLMEVARGALRLAVAVAHVGGRTGDIGFAIQEPVEKAGFNVGRTFVGNRISTAAHDAPPIPCYGRPGQGPRLRRDWVLSIFAIVHAGTFETRIANDGWNAVARDGRKSVLFSQMVVVGDTAGQALTRERR